MPYYLRTIVAQSLYIAALLPHIVTQLLHHRRTISGIFLHNCCTISALLLHYRYTIVAQLLYYFRTFKALLSYNRRTLLHYRRTNTAHLLYKCCTISALLLHYHLRYQLVLVMCALYHTTKWISQNGSQNQIKADRDIENNQAQAKIMTLKDDFCVISKESFENCGTKNILKLQTSLIG